MASLNASIGIYLIKTDLQHAPISMPFIRRKTWMENIVVRLYVDDFFFFFIGNGEDTFDGFKEATFKELNDRLWTYVLLSRHRSIAATRGISTSQKKYVDEILEKFKMGNAMLWTHVWFETFKGRWWNTCRLNSIQGLHQELVILDDHKTWHCLLCWTYEHLYRKAIIGLLQKLLRYVKGTLIRIFCTHMMRMQT